MIIYCSLCERRLNLREGVERKTKLLKKERKVQVKAVFLTL
jgi:hypothetical protein